MSRTFSELRSVADFINGAAFKPEDWGESGARIIRIQNLTDSTKPFNRTTRTVPEKVHVRPGDLLVSWSASLGVFEWNEPDVALLNQHIFRVIPNESIVSKRYLRYGLELALLDMQRHLHGATMQHVNRDEFLSTQIYVPPLSEQHRIAAILDKADALRVKRQAIADRLGAMPDALFSELERSPDFAGWPNVSLRDAFWFQEGPGVRSSQFRPEGVKLLNVGNIEKKGTLNLSKTKRFISEEEFKSKYRHFAVDEGDFVIASSGISFDADGLLRTRGAFVQGHHLPLCMNTSTIRFKAVKDKSSLRFLSGWLNSSSFRSQITRFVTGSAQQNFGPSHLEAIRIALPPLRVQQFLADKFAAIDRLRDSHESSLATMHELFSTLQHQAFSGAL